MPPKKAGGKKNAYAMAPVIPAGEVISNFQKKQWRIGKFFASGGFGRLYLADETTEAHKSKHKVVVKMEPAENGPLFQETHVYQRIAKPEMLENWKKKNGLKFLGLPAFLGSGRHIRDKFEFRFLVIPHFGSDLESVRSLNPKMPPSDVFHTTKCVLHSLEYLHSVQYVHADVKTENLLFSTPSSHDMKKLVLVDFGLAKRVADKPTFSENPKKAHDGTLIFTSLDAHKGAAPSYRGDVEILAYNVLYWLTGSLPWIKDSTKPAIVAQKKEEFAKSPQKFLKCLLPKDAPFLSDLQNFFDEIYALDYAEKPNFDLLHKLIDSCLKKSGTASPSKALKSPNPVKLQKSAVSLKRKVREIKLGSSSEESEAEDIVPQTPTPSPKKKAERKKKTPAKKSKASGSEDSSLELAQGPSTPSGGRVIPGLANMVPVLRQTSNGPVLIPTAVVNRASSGPYKRKSIGKTLVKKYLEKERVKAKPERKKRKTSAELVEEETQTSPGMWVGVSRAKK